MSETLGRETARLTALVMEKMSLDLTMEIWLARWMGNLWLESKKVFGMVLWMGMRKETLWGVRLGFEWDLELERNSERPSVHQ